MEKSLTSDAHPAAGRWKFILGGLLIIAAVAYLVISSTRQSAEYFLTVDEVNQRRSELTGRDLRVSGAVLGESIRYDPDSLVLNFTIAHIPGGMQEVEELGGMARVLHNATLDPVLPRLEVVYHGVRPDLLTNEAQAILTGRVGTDGVFTARELLLKCPTRYKDALPEQVD